jgi:hypothetical protein
MQKKVAELEDLGAALAADKEQKIQTLSQALRSREVNNNNNKKKKIVTGNTKKKTKKQKKLKKLKNSGGGETWKADNIGFQKVTLKK